jgi:uncharacterized repeat protein (TIGR03803 family)
LPEKDTEGNNVTEPIRWKRAFYAVLFCSAVAAFSPAQTYNVLINFNGSNGSGPNGVVQGTDGNFYGTTTAKGGAEDTGTVFKLTPAGKMTVLHRFAGTPDGASPRAELVLGADGLYRGTTSYGGANNLGAIYEIKTGGKLTTLHSFSGADGSGPDGALLLAADGNYYGTTYAGGANTYGTVYKITPAGVLTTLHSFTGTDGSEPIGKLLQYNGIIYGTTSAGGANSKGTVFKITTAGALTRLYSFTGAADGGFPAAGLALGADKTFYGTTGLDGSGDSGTVFKITPSGKLTTIYSFCSQTGCPDGSYPESPLMLASDGNFYGTTMAGGSSGSTGTICRITPAGILTTLQDGSRLAGIAPRAALIEGSDGNLYGTMGNDGTNCCGVVFQLAVGLSAPDSK